MTLCWYSSVLLNPSSFEACETDTQEQMVLISAVVTYSAPVFVVSKGLFWQDILKLFEEEQTRF